MFFRTLIRRWANKLVAETKKETIKIEIVYLVITSLLFILISYKLLIVNTKMFSHDTIWYYGLIHYYCDSIMNGFFPYWDAYDYCGQPFYYNGGIARVFEFPTIALLILNKFINGSFLSLYHWDFILRLIIIATGVYLCFRQTNKYVLSNFIIFVSFLFSSFSFASMGQCGLLTAFMWTPWSSWFLLRLRNKFNLYNMVGTAFFTGLSLISYQAGYVVTFLELFLFSFLLHSQQWHFSTFKKKKNIVIILAGIIIGIMFSLQAIAIFIEKDNSMPIIRLQYLKFLGEGPVSGDHYEIANKDRAPACLIDFIGLIIPIVAVKEWQVRSGAHFSEGPLYMGIIPFGLAVLGIIFARRKDKYGFLFLLSAVILLMLDSIYKFEKLGLFIFPFLKYTRHMQLFQPFFLFVMMYFVGQGADQIIEWDKDVTK